MNFAKLFQGIIVGGLFSGTLSAIFAAYVTLTSNTVDSVGLKAKDFWWLAMLFAGFYGSIAGAILGGVVSALNLGIKDSGLFGFLITAILAILFLLLSEGKFDENFRRFGILFIVIATFTGIFVSFIQMSSFKNE
ncbi:MAG TPA: hypothetical protein VF556_07055 [Pyrinomonadaceae bacterium]|jgi:uncharacterized oligopeptide transporter (OPT) family protein